MQRTGVFATDDEKRILEQYTKGSLVISFSDGVPIYRDPQKLCHEMALEHGLPEIKGYYGIIEDGEFVKM